MIFHLNTCNKMVVFIYLINRQTSCNLPGPMVGQWRRQWHPTPVLLPGKSHGQRNLVGCSSWGRWESDRTERLHFHFSLSCVGEGNGTPLQCSCLENPRDGGTLWAAVYGVAQSRTRLKRLSSSMVGQSPRGRKELNRTEHLSTWTHMDSTKLRIIS